MRYLTSEEVYFYFKDRYVNCESMVSSFLTNKFNDKDGKYLNKRYLIQRQYRLYSYDELMEMIKYIEHEHNTICYAQQLIVDLEAIFEAKKINGHIAKIAKIAGIVPQVMYTLNISYDRALKVIENIETKIKSLSIEAIQELKSDLKKVSEWKQKTVLAN